MSGATAPELQRIVNKCIAKDREERYQTAKDLAIDIRGAKRDSESHPSGVAACRFSGGDPVRVTEDALMDHNPLWSPEGKHLFFISNRGGGPDIYRVPIHASGAPSGPPERLTTGLGVHTMSLSRAGTRLAYSVWESGFRRRTDPPRPPLRSRSLPSARLCLGCRAIFLHANGTRKRHLGHGAGVTRH
ncbi:MAG: hypothetical protein BMS9Abin37_2379 [Acidobacteriota bacterium]|nr:MAG: hypothetical protein BMS9Abin37_2379 [Acidobacteriota bacterium]